MAVTIPNMPQPSNDELEELARKIGYSLPPSYVSFVNAHDGAEPEANSLTTANNEVGISRFIPVNEAFHLAASIEGFPGGVIPLAEDDCGNYFYIEPQTGAVHFWDHEVENPYQRVAQNALVFSEMLMPFDPSTVKISPGQATRVWVDPSFKPEF